MKRLLLAFGIYLSLVAGAAAQCNGVFPNNTVCGNITGSGNVPRPTNPSAFLGAAGGTNGQIQYNNSGALGGFGPVTGDIGLTVPGAVSTIQPNAVTTPKLQNAAVTNAKLLTGAANTYKGSADGISITDIAITGLLNAICSLLPSTCITVFGYNNIYWYGAKCDGIFQSNQNFDQGATNLSITSGTTLLTSSGSTFTSADVGKVIYVPGAGVAGAGLSTTIASFVAATQVNLAVAASTTLATVAATNAAPFVYGTDDTTNIQAAFTANPIGVKLYIPGNRTGCIIRQQGANTYAIRQNKSFSVVGDGHSSNLMTFPDIPATVDDLLVDGSAGWDWTNITWSGFSIGMSPAFIPPTFLMYKRYGRRGLFLSGDFVAANIDSMFIGESGNDHSIYIGSPSGGSQLTRITRSRIFGGIHLATVADSFKIEDNFLYGASSFGGLFEFVAGAGGFLMTGNNVTWAGCTVIESGTKPILNSNYFEESLNSVCPRNAMVDFNGGVSTISMPTFIGNIVNSLGPSATPVRYSNASGGNFGDNLVITSTARTAVISTTGLSCISPNLWGGGGTHFSTALANTYGGC